MKRLLTLSTFLLLSFMTFAQTKVGGIYYRFSEKEATVVSGAQKYTGDVIIPASVTYGGQTYDVTSIESAFWDCSGLTSVIIPNSVTRIGGSAFSRCSGLKSIEIPNSVTSIGGSAFHSCSGLKSIEIPNSVTSIGSEAFSYCYNLNSLIIHNGVTSIGSYAFSNCYNLTSVDIPNSVTSIGIRAFYGCSVLKSIEIPNSVTSIGSEAFLGCSWLTSITFPNSVTSIGKRAFYNTAWYDNQPDGLIYTGKVVYEYKGNMPSNTSITIKDGTIGIADYAFCNCYGLTSIDIPNSVASIGSHAFSGCFLLSLIYSYIENPTSSTGSKFDSSNYANAILYVPKGTIGKYQATDGWKDFTYILEMDVPSAISGVTAEDADSFNGKIIKDNKIIIMKNGNKHSLSGQGK